MTDEIYPAEGRDLLDPPEPWHWKRAACAVATGIIGAILAFGSTQGAPQNIPVGPVRILGGVLLILAILASVVTRFWTRYAALGGGGKTLAWIAILPGAVVLFIWYYVLYVFYLIIIAVFNG